MRQTLRALQDYFTQRFLEVWLPENGALFKEHLQSKGYWFGPQVANMTK